MSVRLSDTIAAISTPLGRGGLGIVRISGTSARAVAERLLRFSSSAQWHTWGAMLAGFYDEQDRIIDQVVVTFFEAPRSYTAEDVVEIACHGAPVVLRYCLERACAAGARLAEPGEFTLRAYLNGRIDLPQAEAVRDLIEATTLYQARVAMQQVEGSVSRRLRPGKERLLELVALLEAGIDFADNDVDVAPTGEIVRRIDELQAGVSRLASSFAFGKLVYSGFSLAIVGRPNVGKSSLFNRLLEQDRAIVTEIPGTTRDLVSEVAAIEGIPIRFIDTAGIRVGLDRIESLGIERSYQAMADADLTIAVVNLAEPVNRDDQAIIERARATGRSLVVGNKADLPRAAELDVDAGVSASTGAGIGELRQRIIQAVAPGGEVPQEAGFITSLRHEQLLHESVEALGHARAAALNHIPHEMLLLDLYAALGPLDAITGATTADDILNRIFSTFCVGK